MSTNKKLVFDYDTFVNEGFANPTASVFNTPGMGNASVGSTIVVDSADQDKVAKHLKIHERSNRSDAWMRPNGDYSNRNWLVPNYETYQNQKQSNARFSIGETVRCIDPMKDSHGMIGKIVAFEDNTIRWEVSNSATGVGQTAKQFRCHAAQLEAVAITPEGIC
jgi:hypothetical protein